MTLYLQQRLKRGEGDTSAERDARLLTQAKRRVFVYKDLPRWVAQPHNAPVHIEDMAHILREFQAMGPEYVCSDARVHCVLW